MAAIANSAGCPSLAAAPVNGSIGTDAFPGADALPGAAGISVGSEAGGALVSGMYSGAGVSSIGGAGGVGVDGSSTGGIGAASTSGSAGSSTSFRRAHVSGSSP